jgi:hypothetical protein
MNKTVFNIRILNESFGELLNETFMDEIQFKLFLKMVHGCVELSEDLTFYNGETFFINVPHKILKSSVIVTNTKEFNMSEQVKSKIEALVTK